MAPHKPGERSTPYLSQKSVSYLSCSSIFAGSLSPDPIYLISQDVGIKDVADLLGHENISSTMRYAAGLKTRVQEIHALKNPFSK
jgi:hypothetical protein